MQGEAHAEPAIGPEDAAPLVARILLLRPRMTLSTPAKLRLVRGDAQPGRARTAGRWRRLWIGATVCAATATAVVYSETAGRRRTARSIPDEQRVAVFQRTLDEVKRSCGGRPDGLLAEHCRELASFLSRFDECRGECEALVRSQLAANPTR